MGIKNYTDSIRLKLYTSLIKKAFYTPGENFFFKKIDKKIHSLLINNDSFPKEVQEKKYEFLISILSSTKRNLDKNYISKEVSERLFETFLKENFTEKDKGLKMQAKFKEKRGILPPSFIVLSPTQKCNLSCTGCYASSKMNCPTLPYETVDKIVNEVYNEWGNHFMTISGGEPLLYSDSEKTLFDIWEKYNKMFFMFYTNSTLLNKENAHKLAKLGNVSPAISIEGKEKETDERRGKGIFKKIIEATDNLKEAGVPFGVSVTATACNIDLLLDDSFYDFIFKELGASYMWMFQLMPIGQAKDMKKLMITPEQRVKLYQKWEHILKEKRYAIADFWNSGVLSDGCIAYGRNKGYLYIDWNGNIMPCVFVPFYKDNILDLHKQNKGLSDALFSDFFVNGRKWQDDYGLNNKKKPHNWLMPCSIRDHWSNFKTNILTANCKPEDIHAEEAITSKEYSENLEEFDENLKNLTDPIWKKQYLGEK